MIFIFNWTNLIWGRGKIISNVTAVVKSPVFQARGTRQDLRGMWDRHAVLEANMFLIGTYHARQDPNHHEYYCCVNNQKQESWLRLGSYRSYFFWASFFRASFVFYAGQEYFEMIAVLFFWDREGVPSYVYRCLLYARHWSRMCTFGVRIIPPCYFAGWHWRRRKVGTL